MSSISTLNKFLTFVLADEEYAVPVENVREVLEVGDITKVPGTQPSMRGVINVRGSVVPVVDLRLKFGMSETEKTRDTCIIVMELRRNDTEEDLVVIGALADSVQEVLELSEEHLVNAPRFGSAIDSRFIQALAKHNEEFIMVLDLLEVFGHQETQVARDYGSGNAKAAAESGEASIRNEAASGPQPQDAASSASDGG